MTDYVGKYQLLMANGKATLQDVLDLHAHELAEQIRSHPTVAHYGHGTFEEGSEHAANSIDPWDLS